MSSHPLTNFQKEKYYKNEPKFNGVYSGNSWSKIKDVVYIINLDWYEPVGTHWITWYVNDNNVIYFDSFRLEHIPKSIRKFIRTENFIKNIYRIQAYNSIMCG